jgi:hypothetical protein
MPKKMTQGDSKAALAQQRSELRRGARGKARVGDDAGAAAGHAAERARVRRMRELLRERREAARLEQPLAPMLVSLTLGGVRLAVTLFSLPLRLALALRGHAPRPAHA